MNTELTLELDQTVITSAKEYAEKNHKNLSKLVEDFFKNLSYGNNSPEKYPLIVEKLSGVITEDDLKKLSFEDDRARYILKEKR